MSEKTEKATVYKLKKAHEKGLVSKSAELNTCIMLLVMLGLITALWSKQLNEIKKLLSHLLFLATQLHFNLDNITHLNQFILNTLISLWLPFVLVALLTIILSSVSQTGFVWSISPLIPDFKRFNIMQGWKKLFSLKTGFDALKSMIKLIASAC
ncbi:MAG: EscU/YscU/HrcU family type III secretion system export apparatus switch protein, partial [bacterium]|nr:EscU/YscU/HrcU family type III secretion system export apparatus switch protein [bacterium]